jgi:hypothetical protein
VTGGWRKLHNEGLCDLYSSPCSQNDQVEKDEMGGTRSMNEVE